MSKMRKVSEITSKLTLSKFLKQGSVNGYNNSTPQGINCFIDHLTTLQSIILSCITTLPKEMTQKVDQKDFFFKLKFFRFFLINIRGASQKYLL